MSARVEPVTHHMEATDQITIPASLAREGMILQVNSALTVENMTSGVTLEKLPSEEAGADLGIDRDNDAPRSARDHRRHPFARLAPKAAEGASAPAPCPTSPIPAPA